MKAAPRIFFYDLFSHVARLVIGYLEGTDEDEEQLKTKGIPKHAEARSMSRRSNRRPFMRTSKH